MRREGFSTPLKTPYTLALGKISKDGEEQPVPKETRRTAEEQHLGCTTPKGGKKKYKINHAERLDRRQLGFCCNFS